MDERASDSKPANSITLTKLPQAIQLAIKARLESGATYRQIRKETGCSFGVIRAIKQRTFLDREGLERVKTGLPAHLYSIAKQAIDTITPAKLAVASAPQLITVAAIAIDKARLMEGLSTDNISVRAIVPRIQGQLEEARKAQDMIMELVAKRRSGATVYEVQSPG